MSSIVSAVETALEGMFTVNAANADVIEVCIQAIVVRSHRPLIPLSSVGIRVVLARISYGK